MPFVQPAHDEVERFAFSLYQRRGEGKHGFDKADWYMAKRAVIFHKHYERVVLYPLVAPKPVWLGDKKLGHCRFCQPGSKRTFSDDSHAVPHLLGNRSLFAGYECDQCNKLFSQTLEDHLGKMLTPVRAVLGIRGKKGIPSYKTDAKKSRIDYKDNTLVVSEIVDDRIATTHPAEGAVRFRLKTQAFIPLAVFKCLTKIALSIMPDGEVPHFADAFRWVYDSDHAAGPGMSGAVCFLQMLPGPLPNDHAWVELFRRRDDRFNVPYMTVVVVSKNIVFQIPLHFCDRDVIHDQKRVEFPRFPAGCGLDYDFGEPQCSLIDLSSTAEARVAVSIELRGDEMQNTKLGLS